MNKSELNQFIEIVCYIIINIYLFIGNLNHMAGWGGQIFMCHSLPGGL